MGRVESVAKPLLAVMMAFIALAPANGLGQKPELLEQVNDRESQAWDAASQIWRWAEPGYQESRSAKLLSDWLGDEGFRLTRKVAGMPTAFVAEFGEGKPIVGILGEFDALPGLSQDADPVRKRRSDNNSYGHGCGHHLFGVASAQAAMAIADQIRAGKVKGTVRFYGCPAEEGGSAKVFMVEAGLFKDCGAVLHWHPSSSNSAGDRSTLARMAVKFRFYGRSAHAAGAPEQGRSALDGVELTNHATQLLREHTPKATRIHHVITAGGNAPNVVPDFAEAYYYVRHPDGDVVRQLYRRLVLCAQAGALATETELKIGYEGGIREILPNNVLAQISMRNLREQNDMKYSDEATRFATRLQQTLQQPEPLDSVHHVVDRSGRVGMGSTDVGDVSWNTPTTGFSTACFVPGTPGHSWQAVACGASPIARQGLNIAARTLAATAWDLYAEPAIIRAAQEELDSRIGERKYRSLMQPGQKPPLDYRKPPQK
jgi:aminobenzoyl-glutamate utilization protein B